MTGSKDQPQTRNRDEMERLIPAESVRYVRERWGLSPARAALIAGGWGPDVWRSDETKGAPIFRFRSFCSVLGEDATLYFSGPPDPDPRPRPSEQERERVVAKAEAELYALKAAARSRVAAPPSKPPRPARNTRRR